MSNSVGENGSYSDEILTGIVDVVQLCTEWSKDYPVTFIVYDEENGNDEQIQCRDVVEFVNKTLDEKCKDQKFIARLWEAIYHESPGKLTLNDSSGAYTTLAATRSFSSLLPLAI